MVFGSKEEEGGGGKLAKNEGGGRTDYPSSFRTPPSTPPSFFASTPLAILLFPPTNKPLPSGRSDLSFQRSSLPPPPPHPPPHLPTKISIANSMSLPPPPSAAPSSPLPPPLTHALSVTRQTAFVTSELFFWHTARQTHIRLRVRRNRQRAGVVLPAGTVLRERGDEEEDQEPRRSVRADEVAGHNVRFR